MREEPQQEQRTIQGGTRVRGDEAEVWIRQGALSRTGQEREPIVCDVRSGEPVPGPQAAAEGNTWLVSIEAARLSPERAKEKVSLEERLWNTIFRMFYDHRCHGDKHALLV
jgi:hypothetical protein